MGGIVICSVNIVASGDAATLFACSYQPSQKRSSERGACIHVYLSLGSLVLLFGPLPASHLASRPGPVHLPRQGARQFRHFKKQGWRIRVIAKQARLPPSPPSGAQVGRWRRWSSSPRSTALMQAVVWCIFRSLLPCANTLQLQPLDSSEQWPGTNIQK